ncbi:MAG: 2Fe-2S iron-sulfur cluster-binding protein [Chitinophagaceae bacterium]
MPLSFIITDIIPETPDASSFLLSPLNGEHVPYKAGQFLTLLLTLHGRAIRRSYSLSSSPGADHALRITVKRVENGEVSRHLLDHLKKGDMIEALPPAGMFVYEEGYTVSRDVFLLAAGSGIVPIFSLLKYLLHLDKTIHIVLVYQNHSVRDTIFRNELEILQKKHNDRFTWIDIVRPEHLNNEALEKLIEQELRYNKADARFYTCGPPLFMNMCVFSIRTIGFSSEQVKREFFTTETLPPPPLAKDATPKKVTILANGNRFSFQTQYPSTILESALQQGISLPYSCRNGRCSSCVARCVEGALIMNNNEVLTDKDIRNGLRLICTGYALTNITLQYEH